MSDPLGTLLDWIDIDSTSGREGDYAEALARHLEGLGFDVERQELGPDRFNLLVRSGAPELIFCTHLDTVPPWFGPRADREFVHGRGSCDAKGPALAMVRAAQALLEEGERRVGLLFTLGEEVDSAGAKLANERLAEPWRPRFTVVGEPTANRFVAGHKGLLKARVCARGVAGHSSRPAGPSAVHELVEVLGRMLERDWGRHGLFGDGSLNVGLLEGGRAGNVVADGAAAELVLRLVEEPAEVEARLAACLGEHSRLELEKGYGPVSFRVPEGAAGGEVVGFGTDAPFLDRWGTPLLYGPGSIDDAHTDHECLSRASFERAVGEYAATARRLLAEPD